MTFPEITDGPAVARHESLEAPFVAQNLGEKAIVSTARITFETVVGTHYFADICLLNQSLESRQIGLVEVAKADVLCIETVTVPFGTAVYGKMFGTSK